MFRKKCTPCYMAHPIVCGMVAGFAVIGLVGVLMAMKKKAKRLGRAAKRIGLDCVDRVEEMAEDAMESGMDAIERMANRGCGC